MKKTLLNLAISVSLSTVVLSTAAYADSSVTTDNNSNDETTETYLYSGMSIGAAAGTAIAGPVGFAVGGLIGALFGSNQEVAIDSDESKQQITITEYDNNEAGEVHTEFDAMNLPSVEVAQLGSINVVEIPNVKQHEDILDILTKDLSLDIYFRSGGTAIEAFYPARLTAIAKLMASINQLELHLDGYTDRRGDQSQNIILANQRLSNVRQQLIDSGVNENRIFSKAFGEKKMVSQAGDLEGYTFDRKVVIRFERSSINSIHVMTEALSETADKDEAEPTVAEAATRF
jgi:outer membrane protein OmpA-like peptidoglycan-associated protein